MTRLWAAAAGGGDASLSEHGRDGQAEAGIRDVIPGVKPAL